jgi:phosphoglycolate phosphatase-like HAD superfamily hydrolase
MYQKINNNNFIPTMRRCLHIDYIIFDIDGVLIDVKKSYNEAIKNTVQFIVRNLIKRDLKDLVTDKIILKFRQTGGFNNDADTSYAISLALLSHQDLVENANLEKFLIEVAEHADETGIESVEKYIKKLKLNKISPSDYLINIDKILDYLNYPGKVGDSIVSTVFDEFFYGQELFLERYKIKSKYYFGKPLIENDRIVITDNTVRKLIERFNDKIAMVSGRSKIAAAYALDNKFYLLNEKNSVFLEDEDRKFAKPNPYGLKKIINKINTRNDILYCGDSVEDLIMARRAEEELNQKNSNKTKTNIVFCGIYGCSSNTDELIGKFMEKKADIIIKSVNDLPYILNKVS